MKRVWIFLANTFEINTRGTKRTALSLFEDTYAKLKFIGASDATIMAIYLAFEPFYEAYRDMYALKQSTLGIYEGHTLQFETVLGEMPHQVRVWEGKVRAEYIEDSPEERMIFPGKRSPFLNGTYEERINAVKALSNTLNGFATLTAVKTLVDTYYNRLAGARLVQQGQEGSSDQLSSLLEDQRIITCKELYGVLGQLMNYYRYNPDRVADYFDLSLLRVKSGTGSTTMFSGKVTDFNTSNPIPNALVSLPQIGAEATTNENGDFEMEVETGTFTVEVIAAGYLVYQQPNVVFSASENKVLDIALKQ